MAKKFNFADAANTPIAQSATETMAKAFETPQTHQTHPLTPSREEGGGIDTPSGQSGSDVSSPNTQHPTTNTQHPTPITPAIQSTPDAPSLNGRAGEGLPSTQSTSNTPSLNGRDGVGLFSPIEHLAQRRIQVINEYNEAAVQAINLKTFPEAGNWKLEEVVRMFNLKRTPGTPKFTKGALAEMLLLDAANDLYEKVCGR